MGAVLRQQWGKLGELVYLPMADGLISHPEVAFLVVFLNFLRRLNHQFLKIAQFSAFLPPEPRGSNGALGRLGRV
jgi:hypothetical protein